MVFWNVTPYILVANSSQPNKNSPENESNKFLRNDGTFQHNYKEWLCSEKNESVEVYLANLKQYSCIHEMNYGNNGRQQSGTLASCLQTIAGFFKSLCKVAH